MYPSCRNQAFQIYLLKTVGFLQMLPPETVAMQKVEPAQALAHPQRVETSTIKILFQIIQFFH